MLCNLCHAVDSHTRTCATLISGHDWAPVGQLWERLAGLSFALWSEYERTYSGREYKEVHDRIQEALSAHDPARAYEILSAYVS